MLFETQRARWKKKRTWDNFHTFSGLQFGAALGTWEIGCSAYDSFFTSENTRKYKNRYLDLYEEVVGKFSSWDEAAEQLAQRVGVEILWLEEQKAAYKALRNHRKFGAQHELTLAVKTCYLETWKLRGCDPCMADTDVDFKQACPVYTSGKLDLSATDQGGIGFFTACHNNKLRWRNDKQRILEEIQKIKDTKASKVRAKESRKKVQQHDEQHAQRSVKPWRPATSKDLGSLSHPSGQFTAIRRKEYDMLNDGR